MIIGQRSCKCYSTNRTRVKQASSQPAASAEIKAEIKHWVQRGGRIVSLNRQNFQSGQQLITFNHGV